MKRILFLALIFLAQACGSKQGSATTSDNNADSLGGSVCGASSRRIVLPFDNIKEIRSREQYDYSIAHYWDNFEFEAEDVQELYSMDELNSVFAQYVMIIPQDRADSLLRGLIHRAEVNISALDMFSEAAHTVLYDPNSPVRNDEYYIPILEELAKSPILDEYDRMIPQHTLNIVKQNRVGAVANNFVYTLRDGKSGYLHNLKADYIILLFNNPGCEMCREIIDDMESSERLKALSQQHNIITLAVYPDEDLEAWYDYLETMPKGWICSYDKDMVISDNNLYDLKAIPSLYLLDRKKHVLIKDGVSVQHVEQLISQGVQL